MIKKIFIKIALIIGLLTTVVLVGLFIYSNIEKKFSLNLIVSPKDSQITVEISGQKIENTSKLPQGRYTIKVEKEGYITDIREVELKKNTNLEINLIAKLANFNITNPSLGSKNIYPLYILPDNGFINYNSSSKGLEIETGNQITTLNKGDLLYLSNNYPMVSYKLRGTEKIYTFNIINATKEEHNTELIQPAIYNVINPLTGTLFILGQYDPASRVSKLFKKDTNDINFVELLSTNANKLDLVTANFLLLIEERDHPYSNFYNFYQIDKGRNVIQTQNSGIYSISPSKEQIAIAKEKEINIFNTINFSKNTINWDGEGLFVWKDESTLLLIKKTNNQLVYSFIDTIYGSQTESVIIPNTNGLGLSEIINLENNNIHIRTKDNKILTINLSS